MKSLSHPGSDSPFKSYEDVTKWLKEKEEAFKKKEAKKTDPKSIGLLFLILGISPFAGMAAMIGQLHLFQMALDAIRAIH
jgi:hypothetical protein